jgi:hypothetical protein
MVVWVLNYGAHLLICCEFSERYLRLPSGVDPAISFVLLPLYSQFSGFGLAVN